MPEYSFAEMADMHFMYGRANGCALEARRLYHEAFPNRPLPSDKLFTNLHQRLREIGTFTPIKSDCGRSRTTRTVQAEERVLQLIAVNPSTSTRRISDRENIPKSTVCEILHEQLLHPYHLQRVQALKPQDFQPRLEFCEWLQMKCRQDRFFLDKVLFTDEAGFTREGIVNFHNSHVWADVNPYAFFEGRFQDKFSINVWAGILGDRLIGPYFMPRRLDGPAYVNFLAEILPELLEDVPIGLRAQLFFMHDGAPAHFSVLARNHLSEIYPNRWIGRAGPIAWPPRSPDLNPLDYFLWGYLKHLVYSVPVENVQQLEQRVIECCQVIRHKQGIFRRVRRSMRKRLRGCIEMNGSHFQHLL